ncbi:MAG TPA: L,D-transpeptidase family protein [Chloroflexota bacterium]|nr:L,D-transpeptidase family protein [Chloroflexota bacterium]
MIRRAVLASLGTLPLAACAVVTVPARPPAASAVEPPPPAPLISLFRRELAPPAAPRIAPLPNGGSLSQRTVTIEWAPAGHPDALAGYAYALSRGDDTPLPDAPMTATPSASLEVPEDGEWVFRVRALDNWGNWSDPAATHLHVDSVPLEIRSPKHRTFSTNPGYAAAPISFTLSRPASARVEILPTRSDEPVRTYALDAADGDVKLEWNGRDESGQPVAAGAYRYRVVAEDAHGRRAEVVRAGLSITHKRIVISLAQQRLWAYDGDVVALTTLITSGGPQTSTPPGTFEILTRQTPFTFRSPWPKGHPFWYPDSPATYAMLFEESGFFLHDAPWRGNFGPGSNTLNGTPGGDFTGTHGCVNIPAGAAAQLFRWSEVGVPVVIY